MIHIANVENKLKLKSIFGLSWSGTPNKSNATKKLICKKMSKIEVQTIACIVHNMINYI